MKTNKFALYCLFIINWQFLINYKSIFYLFIKNLKLKKNFHHKTKKFPLKCKIQKWQVINIIQKFS